MAIVFEYAWSIAAACSGRRSDPHDQRKKIHFTSFAFVLPRKGV
jgi:hypothetical protein